MECRNRQGKLGLVVRRMKVVPVPVLQTMHRPSLRLDPNPRLSLALVFPVRCVGRPLVVGMVSSVVLGCMTLVSLWILTFCVRIVPPIGLSWRLAMLPLMDAVIAVGLVMVLVMPSAVWVLVVERVLA